MTFYKWRIIKSPRSYRDTICYVTKYDSIRSRAVNDFDDENHI